FPERAPLGADAVSADSPSDRGQTSVFLFGLQARLFVPARHDATQPRAGAVRRLAAAVRCPATPTPEGHALTAPSTAAPSKRPGRRPHLLHVRRSEAADVGVVY